jgi:hypothetical protein
MLEMSLQNEDKTYEDHVRCGDQQKQTFFQQSHRGITHSACHHSVNNAAKTRKMIVCNYVTLTT